MRLGSCTLERPLGVGGMGAVYLARQERPRRQVAIKVLRPQLASDAQNWPIFLERFKREADATAALDQNHIVPIYAFGEEQGVAYLIMPYLPDGSLADLLARRGPLSIDRALKYLDDIASALDYSHQHGVIHRDVKPSNLLLHADGRLLLGDFGIARPLALTDLPPTQANGANGANPQLTQAGVAMGTPEFMAPEQIKGGALSAATDIYALGIVAYAMLTNRTPFGGTDVPTTLARQLREPPLAPRRLRPDILPGLEAAVLWALAKEPSTRPRTAGEFARAARAGAYGQPFAMPTATPNLYTAGTPNFQAAATPNPYATARLPMARMAAPQAPAQPPQPPQPLAPVTAQPLAPAPTAPGAYPGAVGANGTVAMPAAAPGLPTGRINGPVLAPPPFAQIATGGPLGAGDPTMYDQRPGAYGRAGQLQPAWPGAGYGGAPPAPPARGAQRRGGFCLPILSAIVIVALVIAGVIVANALHAQATGPGTHTGGNSGPALTHTPTPTLTPSPTNTPTAQPSPDVTNWLSASPTTLTFGCATGKTQHITLKNLGPQTVTWDATVTPSLGITLSMHSGDLASGSSASIKVTKASSIASIYGVITFTPNDPSAGQPATVTYSAPPCVQT